MTESTERNYRLTGQGFDHDDQNVYPPFYASRSDELWSNPYLEELRGKLTRRTEKQKKGLDMLDIGTGSGIAAIHWLKLMPDDIHSVTLTDKSKAAVNYAKKNIDKYFGNQIKWHTEDEGEQYAGIIDGKISILIEKTTDERVWPIRDNKYDYIVFNGPHLDIDRNELCKELEKIKKKNQSLGNNLSINDGLLDGICDNKLQANKNFIEKLDSHLELEGYALLTFSDYSNLKTNESKDSLPKTNESKDSLPKTNESKDSLEDLLALARENALVSTFLSVTEFCPDRGLGFLNEISCIPKRKIMLWKNVVFRSVRKDAEEQSSNRDEIEFNLHKTASGFLAAASQIADIYCTKEPVTEELYKEMTDRMQVFYRMFCEQLGWSKGIEGHFILSGFSLPKEEHETRSWTYGWREKGNGFKVTRYSEPEKIKLQDTNIHRLEIRSRKKDVYIDMNDAMNTISGQQSIGTYTAAGTDNPVLQKRYRIQLPPITEFEENIRKEKAIDYFKNKYPKVFTSNVLKDVISDILNNVISEFSLPVKRVDNDESMYFTYCLFSRYSGSARKSAIFYLFSSTEDLPFLSLMRSFGRIANTAANNMLTSLAAYEAAKKAARAAVFARNFSHITGSHVISNPRFRYSLAGEGLTRSFQQTIDESCRQFFAAENDLFKFILAHPGRTEELGANFTRALAELRDKIGMGNVMLENTRLFHEYLQGRFDFIARAIDDTKDQPEPVWFVKDLLDGFLQQTAYLDNLVADVGLRLENMKFYIEIDNSDGEGKPIPRFLAQWEPVLNLANERKPGDSGHLPLEVVWTNPDNRENLDVMVGLPGGMVASHAFYSLLENIIRNSAKYGCKNKQEGQKLNVYELTVKLKYCNQDSKPYYLTSIFDNYSLAIGNNQQSSKEEQPWYLLQKKLEKSFVKDSGEPETEDLGMMEMQACAQLLCKPSDKGIYPGTRKNHGSFNLWTTEPVKTSCDGQSESLTYNLALNMPVLLGCLTNQTCSSKPGFLLCSSNYEALLNQPPFILVVDGKWLSPENTGNLTSVRDALPYRILVIHADAQVPELDLRGARQITNKDLHDKMFSGQSTLTERDLLLSAYRAWLLEWKPPPEGEPWHLWIGLEREQSQVQEAWGHANDYLIGEDNDLVRVMIKSSSKGGTAWTTNSVQDICKSAVGQNQEPLANSPTNLQCYWESERDKPINKKRALLFDNHGNCFPEAYEVEKQTTLDKSSRFYQKLSGAVSPDLFRMLSRPPKENFSFRFFIYTLVEACLTNIVVVDERLAWSLVEESGSVPVNNRFAEDLLEHQKAGVFPVFRFRHEEAEGNQGFYTQVHKKCLKDCMERVESGAKPAVDDLLAHEGITFGESESKLNAITPEQGGYKLIPFNSTQNQADSSTSTQVDSSSRIQADVILIHEGAMDILTTQQGVEWEKEQRKNKNDGENVHRKQLEKLYQLAPMVIRTSGRGRKSRLLGEHLPFIEFGQVSSALLTARNKFSLVRGLLGSVGRSCDLNPSSDSDHSV